MSLTITWLGHSCFLFEEGGVAAIIDPFMTGNPKCPLKPQELPHVDAVLVTHDHGDHVGDAVQIANSSNAICACIVGTAQALAKKGLKKELIPCGSGFNIGGTINVNGIEITMTQAFHTSESGLPAGYVIKMPSGYTIYHAGDTGIFGDMAIIGELYHPNLALLPTGGFYTMDSTQAAYACKLISSPYVIPMHWGTFGVLEQNTNKFKSEVAKISTKTSVLDCTPGIKNVF